MDQKQQRSAKDEQRERDDAIVAVCRSYDRADAALADLDLARARLRVLCRGRTPETGRMPPGLIDALEVLEGSKRTTLILRDE